MPKEEEIVDETRRLKSEYDELFDAVAEILFRRDPIGINFEENMDECYPEVRTILPRLKFCRSSEDVMTAMHEEFQRWLDLDIAGPRENYAKIANEVWLSGTTRECSPERRSNITLRAPEPREFVSYDAVLLLRWQR